MSSSKVRCAVIGLGMGTQHANDYFACPDAELVAVADLNPKRLEKWSPQIGAENCFTDYKEMLKKAKPDLVSVCLPNALHATVTIEAINAGAHVLCEKPMAMSVELAKQMRDAAEKAGKTLGINLSSRFNKYAMAMKDLVKDGAIGDPYHAYTRWTRRDGIPGFGGWFGQKAMSGGGPLIDLGVHRIDLAMWLLGSPQPVTVSGTIHSRFGIPRAQAKGLKFDVEDFSSGFVRFANGASLVFEASWAGYQGEKEFQNVRILGESGGLEQKHIWGDADWTATYSFDRAGHQMTAAISPQGEHLKSSYTEMVHSVRDNRPYLASAEEGIKIQQILDGLYKSAELGREVQVSELG